MISAIIIDDQPEAIDILVQHLKNRPEFELMKTFTDSVEAMNYVSQHKIDLIFIDIQMPVLNGLDFVETVRLRNGVHAPKFIFTTGYSNYALAGFEQGASDYLLKPIGFKRFNLAIERFLENTTKNEDKAGVNTKDFFFVEADGAKMKINYKDIVFIESAGNYVMIMGIGLKKLIYKSLQSMVDLLPKDQFMRIHKSYIISVLYIQAVKGNEVMLKYGSEVRNIPIGATYKESMSQKLNI